MKTHINSTVDALNDLTEILKDGEHGYRTAAKDVKSPELAELFRGYATQRAEFGARLQTEVAALGSKPEDSGSLIGSAHRGWINLKSALSTNEPQAVLEEAERGEDAAVAAYKKAMERPEELSTSTRDLIAAQYSEIKAAHDRVRNLRDSGQFRRK